MELIGSVEDALAILRRDGDVSVGGVRLYRKGGRWFSVLAGETVELWGEEVAAKQLWYLRKSWNATQIVSDSATKRAT